MIRADGYTFQYPTQSEPALEDVSVEVPTGTVLGVLGPVEAGKTTLAMALSSFAPQNTGGSTEGELVAADRDPRDADDNAVAMVFEDYSAQLTQVRVIDEVVAPLVNRGLSRADAIPKARDLLAQSRLSEAETKFTWDLSGGQQQRLAIAAALAIDPEVLIFDTATDMLDPDGREDVQNLIASLKGSKTLVVTANDPDDLVGIADTVLVLEDGQQVAVGPAEDILRDRSLLRSVGVDAPLCVEVAHRLGLDAAPLTPRELSAYVDVDDRGRTVGSDSADGDGGPSAGSDVTPSKNVDVVRATYAYGDGTVAIDGVDLNVYDGEVHAVIGGNGAGKSTFSRLLVGLLNPDNGHVHVSGTRTDEVTAREMATRIGISLQNPSKQFSEQTVEDELRFPLERRQYERTGPLGLSKQKRYDDEYIDERVRAVRELVDLEEGWLSMDPIFLPRGVQQLVSIALAAATEPDALVLDEPTAGLDAASRETVRDTLERLRARDKAIVLIDHDMDFICEVADRVTVLNDGEVAGQGTTEEVFAEENWDWLADNQMRPPRVATLARNLGRSALTVDELIDGLTDELEEIA